MSAAPAVSLLFSAVLLLLISLQTKNRKLAYRVMILLRRYMIWMLRRPSASAVKSAVGLCSLSTALLLLRQQQVRSKLLVVSQSVGATVSSAGSTAVSAFRPENVLNSGRMAVGKVAGATASLKDAVSDRSGRIVSAVSNKIAMASDRLRSSAEAVYEGRLNAVERRLEGYIGQAAQYAGEGLKGSLKDPAMPDVVKQLIDETVDRVLPDVRITAVALTSQKFITPVRVKPRAVGSGVFVSPNDPTPLTTSELLAGRSLWWRTRAWTLYNLSPYDQSMWACARQPLWLALNAVGILPGVNHLWWLLLFLFKDKTDEHQLCDFIIGSESARFFSVGCWGLFMTALRLFVCTIRSPATCDTSGPMLTPWDAIAFVAQTVLVWSAYWMLPHSTMPRHRHHNGLHVATNVIVPSNPSSENTTPSTSPRRKWDLRSLWSGSAPPSPTSATRRLETVDEHAVSSMSFPSFVPSCRRILSFGRCRKQHNNAHRQPGGALLNMFVYHSVLLCVSAVIALIVLSLQPTRWKLLTTLYGLRVLHGLACLPFVLFKLPFVSRLFVCSQATGYDPVGRTLPVCYSRAK